MRLPWGPHGWKTVNNFRGGFVMVDPSVRRLRQAQVLVAFGCGVWLIVLAKGDDVNLKSVAFVGGIYLCSKILLLVADHMQHD